MRHPLASPHRRDGRIVGDPSSEPFVYAEDIERAFVEVIVRRSRPAPPSAERPVRR